MIIHCEAQPCTRRARYMMRTADGGDRPQFACGRHLHLAIEAMSRGGDVIVRQLARGER